MSKRADLKANLCPECELDLRTDTKPLKGELIVCPSCRAELEVVRSDYILLFDLAPETEEDWGE